MIAKINENKKSLFAIVLLLCPMLVPGGAFAADDGELLLRLEVVNPKETVKISAPYSLLGALIDQVPNDIRGSWKEAGIQPQETLKAMKSMVGEDIVRIEGKESVRIWLEEVSRKNRKDAGFVRVQVKGSGENAENINICLPSGLITLAGAVAVNAGLADELLRLPPDLMGTLSSHVGCTSEEPRHPKKADHSKEVAEPSSEK